MTRPGPRVIENLRGLRVAVVHAPDQDCDALSSQLRRIGCEPVPIWPAPVAVPQGVDLVFLQLDHGTHPSKTWALDEAAPAIIVVLEYENPVMLKALLDSGALGVLVKPLRPAGVLSTLVLAQGLGGYLKRQEAKVRKLEESLKAHRDVAKAAKILGELKDVPESQAFELIRNQATRRRISMAQVANAIINAQDVLKDLSEG
ncbi:ANTAR domain-containing protein [Paracoccus liaowanqingii]|uniref:ANTAR domain-containing protein n=1 Tax=Paracoccus liaowanqingii TaxID=2560053 RepID=A0A4Z1CHT4_9RHOB|nr:ANTAR domain-containing protein [Paracoccus liaowanqingii]TGN61856.1 ANTAR domain-containing protein [Paracoccus liaowanqingii]